MSKRYSSAGIVEGRCGSAAAILARVTLGPDLPRWYAHQGCRSEPPPSARVVQRQGGRGQRVEAAYWQALDGRDAPWPCANRSLVGLWRTTLRGPVALLLAEDGQLRLAVQAGGAVYPLPGHESRHHRQGRPHVIRRPVNSPALEEPLPHEGIVHSSTRGLSRGWCAHLSRLAASPRCWEYGKPTRETMIKS